MRGDGVCAKAATASSQDIPRLKPGVFGVMSFTIFASSVRYRLPSLSSPPPTRMSAVALAGVMLEMRYLVLHSIKVTQKCGCVWRKCQEKVVYIQYQCAQMRGVCMSASVCAHDEPTCRRATWARIASCHHRPPAAPRAARALVARADIAASTSSADHLQHPLAPHLLLLLLLLHPDSGGALQRRFLSHLHCTGELPSNRREETLSACRVASRLYL